MYMIQVRPGDRAFPEEAEDVATVADVILFSPAGRQGFAGSAITAAAFGQETGYFKDWNGRSGTDPDGAHPGCDCAADGDRTGLRVSSFQTAAVCISATL